MLRVAIEPTLKTKIMYRAYVSSRTYKDHLDELQRRGYLEVDDTTGLYRTTPAGKNFIQSYENLEI